MLASHEHTTYHGLFSLSAHCEISLSYRGMLITLLHAWTLPVLLAREYLMRDYGKLHFKNEMHLGSGVSEVQYSAVAPSRRVCPI